MNIRNNFAPKGSPYVLSFIITNFIIFSNLIINSIGGVSFADFGFITLIFSIAIITQVIFTCLFPAIVLRYILFLFVVGNIFFFVYLVSDYSRLQLLALTTFFVTLFLFGGKIKIYNILFIGLMYLSVPIINLFTTDFNKSVGAETNIGDYSKNGRSVYIIGIDAMTSRKAYAAMFNDIGSPAYKWLEDNGFILFDTTSPASSTLETWASWLQVKRVSHPRNTIGLLNGSRRSVVYDALRKHEYEIHAAFDTDYYGTDAGMIDSFYPNFGRSSLCSYVDKRWGYFACPAISFFNFEKKLNLPYIEKFDVVANNLKFRNDRPIFFISHLYYPGHPLGGYDSKNALHLDSFKKYYVLSQTRLMEYMSDTFKKIKANDPSAIIAFVGDHGPLMLGDRVDEDVWKLMNYPESLEKLLEMDRHHILLAVYNFDGCSINEDRPELLIVDLIDCAFK